MPSVVVLAVVADLCCLVGQAFINLAAAVGAITGPVIMGALQKRNPAGGWRTFYVSLQHPYARIYTEIHLSGSKWEFGSPPQRAYL
jgi:hypothetical protein